MTNNITPEQINEILLEEAPEFRAFVERFDPKSWVRYDLSALRLGWHFGRLDRDARPVPSVPELLVPDGKYGKQHHYAEGWNDCIDAMLATEEES